MQRSDGCASSNVRRSWAFHLPRSATFWTYRPSQTGIAPMFANRLDRFRHFYYYRNIKLQEPTGEEITRYADMFPAMGTEARLRIMRLLLSAHPEGLVVRPCGLRWAVAILLPSLNSPLAK